MPRPNRRNTLVMLIRKEFFDQILSGRKLTEWRSVTPKYARLKTGNVKYLVLHYRTQRRLLAEITDVRVRKRPKFLSDSPILFTPMVYKIRLARVTEFNATEPRLEL